MLITGHTGFKGAWLSIWLSRLGAELSGIALDPPTQLNLYDKASVDGLLSGDRQDIRDSDKLSRLVQAINPEIIFHLAAQPLVRYSYQHPVETWETNVMGTMNLLEAVRNSGSVKVVVVVTSDKCYLDQGENIGHRETDSLGGFDPYSSSKGAVEILTSAWRNSYFTGTDKSIASVRAGNVIGGGDWAEDRLIPDIIRAFSGGEILKIRYPQAIRPWQHVLEPLSGYLMLAEKLYSGDSDWTQAWNFGPADKDARSVEWIVKQMAQLWGENNRWHIDEAGHPHESAYLKLDCAKSHHQLGWHPRWSLATALEKIVEWHRAEQAGKNMQEICFRQIDAFMASA